MVIGMGRQHTGKKKRNQKRKLDKVLCAVFLTVGCLVILWGILLESGLGKKTKEQVTFTVNGERLRRGRYPEDRLYAQSGDNRPLFQGKGYGA